MCHSSCTVSEIDDFHLPLVYDGLSLWSSRFGVLLVKNLELKRSIQIQDLGCVSGFSAFELAQFHGKRSRVFGIDIWEVAIFRAAQKRRIHNTKNIELIVGDANSLPFPSGQFDLIVSNLGLKNFADPAAVLAKSRRVAKPRARLVLTTNIRGHYREFYEIFRNLLLSCGKSKYLENRATNEEQHGTIESVTGLITSAGFKDTRIEMDEFQQKFVDGTALLNHFLTRVGFLSGWQSVVEASEIEEVFSLLEEKLNLVAEQSGRLVMTVAMLYLEARPS
jgi:arsenite methyltransferase